MMEYKQGVTFSSNWRRILLSKYWCGGKDGTESRSQSWSRRGWTTRWIPRFLALFAEGREQSIRIAGATDGRGGFGPDGSIEFYATGIDTPYSDARVYWLVVGDQPGKRVVQQPISGAAGGEEPSSYPYVVELKQRTTYFAALLKTGTDNFFGALVSSAPVGEVLNVSNIAAASDRDIKLTIALQGVVEGAPHDVLSAGMGRRWAM